MNTNSHSTQNFCKTHVPFFATRCIKHIGIATLAGLFALHSLAQADDICTTLKRQEVAINQAKMQFVLDYPGTSVIFLGCVAAAVPNGGSEPEAGPFLACAGLYCLMNSDTCMDAYQDLAPIISAQSAMNNAYQKYSCN